MKSGGWIAPRYEPGRGRAWHLSILVAQGATAWCVHDASNGDPVALRWSEGLSALDADDLPTQPATVSFVTLPEWSALVPESALVPGTEADHLRFVHGGLPTGAMRTEPLEDLGAVCLFLHDDVDERVVLDRFPSARPVPMQSLMARGALARSAEGPVLLLHRGHEVLDAALADKGRILLSNSYPARSSQDCLYYALLAADGIGGAGAGIRARYGGHAITAHEQDLLKRYFNSAEAAIAPWEGHTTAPGDGPHEWLALLEQFACVS